MRRLLPFLPLAAFAALAAYLAIGLGRDPAAIPSPLVGEPPPAFDLPGLATGDIEAPALVNVFASWCLPCRAEHPLLMRLARRDGVRVYGLAYKDEPEATDRFLAELGDPYLGFGRDRDGRVGLDWGVTGVPETFVIGRDGRIALRHAGPLTDAIVAEQIAPALAR